MMRLNWFSNFKDGVSRSPQPDPLSEPKTDLRGLARIQYLKPFISNHWRKALSGSLLIILAALLTFPQPMIYRYLIDEVILNRQLKLLAVAVFLLAGCKGFVLISEMLQQFLFTRFEQDIMLDIQRNLFEHTLRLPRAFFDKQAVGSLMSRLVSDIDGLRWFFSSIIVHVAANMLRFIGGVIFLFYLEWKLTLIVLIVIPGLYFTARFFAQKLYHLGYQEMEQHAAIMQRIQESLTSSRLIKAYTAEKKATYRVQAEWMRAIKIALERSAVSGAAHLAITIPGELAKIMVYIIGAYQIIQGQWTLGSMLAFLSYLSYVYGPAQFLAANNLRMQNALAALSRISALFEIEPEQPSGVGLKINRLAGEIEFQEVSFAYISRTPVLQDVSFHIHRGEKIVIAGPSGVGKTTLLSLLLCFYPPSKGDILYDNRAASAYDIDSLRERIGYVSQNPILIADTIAANVCYGAPESTFDMMEQAAQTAQILDFIAAQPNGWETLIAEGGSNLSTGQKQRLALARALLKDPDILILDEPTAALDNRLGTSLIHALPQSFNDKTLIIVSHRLSIARQASRVFVFKDARLAAIGSHNELYHANSFYRNLMIEE